MRMACQFNRESASGFGQDLTLMDLLRFMKDSVAWREFMTAT